MHSIDCRGLKCPIPILKVRLKLNKMNSGEKLSILADDQDFEKDFLRFCFQADIILNTKEYFDGYQKYEVTAK